MRLFTAIELPEEVLLRLERLVCSLRPEAQIKWSPLDNLHITTKFIGEWPEARLEELDTALGTLPARNPFTIEIKKLGWFPNERAPRVVWAGAEGGDALPRLAQDTEERLRTLGAPRENRSYSPHLTLARIKNPTPLQQLRSRMLEIQDFSFGSFTAEGFVLYRSDPGSNSSIYRKLREYRFESVAAAATI